jgi:hypothetical protein
MLAIHCYEVVHQEHQPNDEVLVMFYDQIKGGLFYVLLPANWHLHDVLPFLKQRRGL